MANSSPSCHCTRRGTTSKHFRTASSRSVSNVTTGPLFPLLPFCFSDMRGCDFVPRSGGWAGAVENTRTSRKLNMLLSAWHDGLSVFSRYNGLIVVALYPILHSTCGHRNPKLRYNVLQPFILFVSIIIHNI